MSNSLMGFSQTTIRIVVLTVILAVGGVSYCDDRATSLTDGGRPSISIAAKEITSRFSEKDAVLSNIPNPADKSIFWIDQETVVFAGVSGEPLSRKIFTTGQYRLFSWRKGSAPIPFAESLWKGEMRSGGYCAAKGHVYFVASEPGLGQEEDYQIFGGPIGQEKRITREKYFGPVSKIGLENNVRSGRWGCLPVVDSRMQGEKWFSSADGRYFISFGKAKDIRIGDGNAGVELVESETLIRKRIFGIDLSAGCAEHFYGIQAFLIWDCYSAAKYLSGFEPKSECWPYWTLFMDRQEVSTNCIPEEFRGASLSLILTNIGVIAVSHFLDERGGIYHLGDDRPSQIVQGYITQAKVSPDGCRIAFNWLKDPTTDFVYTTYLRSPAILDVCPESKG